MAIDSEKPLVSVIMITYNQQKYVEQAVRSVMSQRTAFPFELIIADDSSSDSTPEICSRLAGEYPGKINLVARNKNLGASANYLDAWSRCRGKYIAICEGDDWWLSPYKLARQVEYMESHPECTVCFHRVANYYPEKHNWSLCGKPAWNDFGLEELAAGNIITNLSVMYRALPRTAIPDWVLLTPLFDYAMHSLHAANGRIHFMPYIMGAYRKHHYGIWSGDALRARRLATEIRRLLIAHFHESHPEAAATLLLRYRDNAIALGAAMLKGNDMEGLDKLLEEIENVTGKYGTVMHRDEAMDAIRSYSPSKEPAKRKAMRYAVRTLTKVLPVSLAAHL